MHAGVESNVAGESLARRTTSCKGGVLVIGIICTLIYEVCMLLELLLLASLGDENSKRSLLGPGVRKTSALK